MANGIETMTYHEIIWRDDTHTTKYVVLVFKDNAVSVSLHDASGFNELYYAESHVHPSEHFTDTIRRLIAKIEDEHFGGK